MIFADTGGWFGLFVTQDFNHAMALEWYKRNRKPLLTTDYVSVGQQFFSGALATIYYLTEDDIRQTWQVFTRYADKEWSFTDCSSKVVMEKLGITEAFAFDQHFRQFGTISVLP